jgi:hypothetical protein
MANPFRSSALSRLFGAGTALLLALTLACGGGGGGSTTNIPPAPSTNAISGAAAKGIIQNGAVTAYELVGGGWAQIGTATTDTTGAYSLTATGYKGGVVKVTITAGSGSRMVWDGPTGNGHTFGTAEPVTSDFSMSAVLPSLGSSGTTSAPITPYTNMAESLVEAALASTTATTAQTAIARVNVMVGFDVSTTPVVDPTNATAMAAATPTAQQAAAMSAAICTFVTGSGTAASAVTKLAASFAGGGFTSASQIPILSLVAAWQAVLANSPVAANLGSDAKNNLLLALSTVANNATNGSYTPTPPTNVPTTQLAAAKLLISDTRSLAYNIASTSATPLKALGLDVDADANIFNRDVTAMTQILGLGLEQSFASIGNANNAIANLEAIGSVTYPVTITSNGQSLGTLTLKVTTPASMVFTLSGTLTGTGASARAVTVNATVNTGLDITKVNLSNGTTSQTAIAATFTGSVSDGTTGILVTTGTLNATLTGSGQLLWINSLSLDNLGLTVNSGSASFTGNASIDFIAANPSDVSAYFHTGHELLGLKTVSLTGTFTVTDPATGAVSKATASIALNILDADTFDIEAFLNQNEVVNFDNWNIQMVPAKVNAILAASKVAGANSSWYVEYGTNSGVPYAYSSGSKTGSYTNLNPSGVDNYTTLISTFDPASLYSAQIASLPTGSTVVDRYLEVYFNGINYYSYAGVSVKLPAYQETTSNFLNATLTANFTATGITGLPDVAVNAAVTRNTLEGGTASLNLSWGTKTYKVNVTVLDASKGTNTVTITDPNSVVLTLTNVSPSLNGVAGTLSVSGTQVGTIQMLANRILKITYADGTFESFQ